MGIIELEGMEFYAYHGCFSEEQIVGNRFLVDLFLETDCTKPSQTDSIHDAVNYQAAYQIVKKQMEQKSHLLEHVASRILDHLLTELPNVQKARVKVSKINPPLGGRVDKVSLIMERYFSDSLRIK